MGQLSHDPSLQHFSHPHPLDLANHHGGGGGHPHNPLLPQPLCAGCSLPPHGYMYACKTCNYTFTLHVSCAELPSLIAHPSHPKHHLTLLQSPAYGGTSFNCDACGKLGTAFCYRCDECDFDMHTTCATKPLAVAHRSHHHQLNLEFFPPYKARWFSCDICVNAGSNHWLYRCAACEFDAHLDCATAPGGPGQTSISPQPQVQQQLQHQVSYPGSYQLPPQNQVLQLQHQNSAPAAVNYNNMRYQNNASPQPYMQQQPALYTQQPYNNRIQQPPPVYAQQQQPSAYVQPQMAPAAYGQPQQQQTVMDTVVQNFVSGAAQQAGQIAVQEILGGGGADPTAADAGSGGGGGDSSVIGSVMGAVFGGGGSTEEC